MKKQIVLITTIWLISLIVIVSVTSKDDYDINGIYKVSINRIHQRLTNDLEKNIQIINNLNQEELNLIDNIEIIVYRNKTYEDMDRSISAGFIYKPIEGSDYIMKYDIEKNDPDNKFQILLFYLVITGAYLYFIIHILMIHINIIKPFKRVSCIAKQLSTGYLGEINLLNKNRYFKEFIWGLDMLREQLLYERDKNMELEKQQKTLVAGLSHDIKTPLSSVKNYAIALKENVYEGKKDSNKALEIILEKVEIIEKLTKELLDTSLKEVRGIEVRTKEIYMIEVHNRLNRIVHQKTDLLHMEYIEGKLGENLMLMVDLERLQEVFDNIIENALKYGDLKSIKINYSIEENYQLIEIYNTGTPIAKTELKYIFNSYYRGSNVNNKPGYGLGLYISKQIMKKMQGDIYVKNTDDGVRFVVVIKQAG